MDLFGHLKAYDYGEVHFSHDKATGLKAIIAIHDSRLGPALGGCRFLPYDTDEDALVDTATPGGYNIVATYPGFSGNATALLTVTAP